VVSVDKINDRTRDVVIDSPSVGETKVRLMLPVGFEANPHRRWPVLYLSHGADDPDTYKCWTRSTDVAALTAGLPLYGCDARGRDGGLLLELVQPGSRRVTGLGDIPSG
jgi:hypothetical protein